jgi:hypothetical protein
MERVKLSCPICRKEYGNYKEYFACWTNHLEQKIGSVGGIPPTDHAEAIRYYKRHPSEVEAGLVILADEVNVFHGRIDLVGVDKDKNLILIDVTTGVDWKRKVEQLRRYKGNIEWMGKKIFGVKPPKMRLLIVRPKEYVKDVTNYTPP